MAGLVLGSKETLRLGEFGSQQSLGEGDGEDDREEDGSYQDRHPGNQVSFGDGIVSEKTS
jgi:hypothetical protein